MDPPIMTLVFSEDIGAEGKEKYMKCLIEIAQKIQLSRSSFNRFSPEDKLKLLKIYQAEIDSLCQLEKKQKFENKESNEKIHNIKFSNAQLTQKIKSYSTIIDQYKHYKLKDLKKHQKKKFQKNLSTHQKNTVSIKKNQKAKDEWSDNLSSISNNSVKSNHSCIKKFKNCSQASQHRKQDLKELMGIGKLNLDIDYEDKKKKNRKYSFDPNSKCNSIQNISQINFHPHQPCLNLHENIKFQKIFSPNPPNAYDEQNASTPTFFFNSSMKH